MKVQRVFFYLHLDMYMNKKIYTSYIIINTCIYTLPDLILWILTYIPRWEFLYCKSYNYYLWYFVLAWSTHFVYKYHFALVLRISSIMQYIMPLYKKVIIIHATNLFCLFKVCSQETLQQGSKLHRSRILSGIIDAMYLME